MARPPLILGLESSCDDTAAALVRGREVLSNVVMGQAELHAAFGGVVPEIAARAHVEKLDLAVQAALKEAQVKLADIDAVAVTAGPGLIGGVLSGVMCAKGIAAGAQKPLIGVNHLAGHALTARLTDGLPYPYLMLLISGDIANTLSRGAPESSAVSAARSTMRRAKPLTRRRVFSACHSRVARRSRQRHDPAIRRAFPFRGPFWTDLAAISAFRG